MIAKVIKTMYPDKFLKEVAHLKKGVSQTTRLPDLVAFVSFTLHIILNLIYMYFTLPITLYTYGTLIGEFLISGQGSLDEKLKHLYQLILHAQAHKVETRSSQDNMTLLKRLLIFGVDFLSRHTLTKIKRERCVPVEYVRYYVCLLSTSFAGAYLGLRSL